MSGIVYFIESQAENLIRIGYTTDLANRLSNLNVAYEHLKPLRVLATMPGSLDIEAALQAQFSDARINRKHGKGFTDWFNFTDSIREYIEANAQPYSPQVKVTTRFKPTTVKVSDRTARVISVLSRGRDVTADELILNAIQIAYPLGYAAAMAMIPPASSEQDTPQ